jgi:hypothetical protein
MAQRQPDRLVLNSFVLKILTSKLFDIKILQTLVAEPAPRKAFRGSGGRGVSRFRSLPRQNIPFREGLQELYFGGKSTGRSPRTPSQISSPSAQKCGRMAPLDSVALGVCMSYRKACLILLLVVIPFTVTLAQVSHSEQVQIAPPLIRAIDPPAPDATAAMLEQQGDALHSAKLYLDALDYYRAALVKAPDNAPVLNKMCRTELLMNRWRDARKSCERAIKVNHAYAEAYGNLAVSYYGDRKYGAAVKQCNKAIAIDNNSASFFNNLGAAYFAEKKFEPAVAAYQHALQLDPQVFERSSRAGVEAQLAGPEDRARFDYTVAKLYAKMGFSNQSLEYLKKAMEDGYKDLKNVYKDEEFAVLRKNPRFTELMASKTTTIPDLPD